MTLASRGAVVTGGGRGIGAACAHALAGAGCRVLVASRTAEEIEKTAASVRESGGQARSHVVDVTDPQSVQELAEAARAWLGAVDVLVNNAGVAGSSPIHRLELDEWNRILSVNATGTFLCTRAFLPGMVERGWGRIVNVASIAGLSGGAYIAAYAASKHAVIGFTRSAAIEVASTGVTVNAVCPGYVDTDMTAATIDRISEKTGRTREQALDAILDDSPLGRLIRPEEVSYAVVALCAEEAGGISGQALAIDGGEHVT